MTQGNSCLPIVFMAEFKKYMVTKSTDQNVSSKLIRPLVQSYHKIEFNVQVLTVDPASKRLKLTAKKSLINTKLPTVTNYLECQKGMLLEGFIADIKDHGVLVVFYNNIRVRVNYTFLAKNKYRTYRFFIQLQKMHLSRRQKCLGCVPQFVEISNTLSNTIKKCFETSCKTTGSSIILHRCFYNLCLLGMGAKATAEC